MRLTWSGAWYPGQWLGEKKLKDKFGDEITLAGLETLVLGELEKHLILNSNRSGTFEDARSVVTNVEAKFGLRTRDAKPG